MGKPKLDNIQLPLTIGVDPYTGKPIKLTGSCKKALKENIHRLIRINDEIECINRYTWNNLPGNITGQELERLLYIKGQVCIYYDDKIDEYYFLPFALANGLDVYARFVNIHPIPLCNDAKEEKTPQFKALSDLLATKKLRVVYGNKDTDDYSDKSKYSVILYDYTRQLNNSTILPKSTVNEALIDVMSDTIAYARTSMITSSGIKGVRVSSADEADSVKEGSESLDRNAIQGNPWVPICGTIDFQELTNNAAQKIEDYFKAYQSLENIKKTMNGIANNGSFEKGAHMLQSEQDMNSTGANMALEDGLKIRERFCEIANKVFGLNMSVSVNEQSDTNEFTDDYEQEETTTVEGEE